MFELFFIPLFIILWALSFYYMFEDDDEQGEVKGDPKRVLHIRITGKRYLEIKGRKMPIKIKKSEKIRNKQTGRTSITHYYAKCTTTTELQNMIDNSLTKAKVKQKCRNELTRRNK